MKRTIFYTICILICAFGIASCNNGKTSQLNGSKEVAELVKVGNSEVVVCHYNSLKDSITIPLSTFIKELKMVKLDGRDEALIAGGAAFISDNYILVRNRRNTPYKLFDKEGKFLTTIGNYGRGPNEYMNVYCDWLDEKTNQIFILPWQANQILRFNLQGEALDPIPLKYNSPKGVFHIDTEKSIVSVFVLPFKPNPVVAWRQDFKGNVIDTIPSGHLAITPDFSNEVYSNRNGDDFDFSILSLGEMRPDSLYHYNFATNKLDPKFTLDFGNKDMTMHSYQELPNHFIGDVFQMHQISENTAVGGYPKFFIVDKKSLKGSYFSIYNDFLGDMPNVWPSFFNGYYTWNINPIGLKDKLQEVLSDNASLAESDKARIQKIVEEIDEEGNNYIFYGKMK